MLGSGSIPDEARGEDEVRSLRRTTFYYQLSEKGMSRLRVAYYVPNKAIDERVRKIVKQRQAGFRNRVKLAEKHFGKKLIDGISVNESGPWGIGRLKNDCRLAPPHWRWHKRKEMWVPMTTKEGKAIAAEMAKLPYAMPAHDALAGILGFNGMDFIEATSHGMAIPNVAYVYLQRGPNKGKIILKVPAKFKPWGCKRISDMQFEKLLASEVPKPKPKKKVSRA